MNDRQLKQARAFINKLLREIKRRGYSFNVNSEGEDLYDGDSVKEAADMIFDLDECWLNAMEDDGHSVAAFLIVIQEFEDVDEILADYYTDDESKEILEAIGVDHA